MMKAFGSCPPEYRIMAVWIFIFLTLLYMILLICEGTGERKKKAMLQDSLLLIAAFLITSGLCVRQGFYEEEDFMVFLKMPYGILIAMGICGFLFAGIQAFGIYKRRTNCLRENAIQESLDNLPSGIGFFDRNGMPKLMNRKMYQLCRNLAGRDIQNITELREALRRPLKPRRSQKRDVEGAVPTFATPQNRSARYLLFQSDLFGRLCQFLTPHLNGLEQSVDIALIIAINIISRRLLRQTRHCHNIARISYNKSCTG